MSESVPIPRSQAVEVIARRYSELFPWMEPADAAITYWLLEIHTSLLAAAERAFARIGEEQPRVRYGILRSLLFAADERLTHNSLVELLRIPPSTVSFMVDALERDGLVERKPHQNRRAAWIQLTSHGKQKAREMVQAIALSMRDMADAAFTREGKARFRADLRRFYDACESWQNGETTHSGS